MNNDIPKIILPGSDEYWGGYEAGIELDQVCPGQDAIDFCYAIYYHGVGPITDENNVAGLLMVEQGYNDGPDWLWLVRLENGEHHWLRGGCDYTGWDCQSSAEWSRYELDPTIIDPGLDVHEIVNVLHYISSPTMGLPAGADAAEFALEGATEASVRLALTSCILMARKALGQRSE